MHPPYRMATVKVAILHVLISTHLRSFLQEVFGLLAFRSLGGFSIVLLSVATQLANAVASMAGDFNSAARNYVLL